MLQTVNSTKSSSGSQHEIFMYFYSTKRYRGCRNGAEGAGDGVSEVARLQAG